MAVLGLRFCARAFSSCGKRGPLFIAVRGPLTIAASLVAGHRLQTRRLSSRGSRAQLLRGMWDLPRPGLEPVCPALAGRLPTTAPPGKPVTSIFKESLSPSGSQMGAIPPHHHHQSGDVLQCLGTFLGGREVLLASSEERCCQASYNSLQQSTMWLKMLKRCLG